MLGPPQRPPWQPQSPKPLMSRATKPEDCPWRDPQPAATRTHAAPPPRRLSGNITFTRSHKLPKMAANERLRSSLFSLSPSVCCCFALPCLFVALFVPPFRSALPVCLRCLSVLLFCVAFLFCFYLWLSRSPSLTPALAHPFHLSRLHHAFHGSYFPITLSAASSLVV